MSFTIWNIYLCVINSCLCFYFFLLIKINSKTQKPIILLKTIQKVFVVFFFKLRIKIIRGAFEFHSSTILPCFVTVTSTWILFKILLFLQPVPNLPNLFSGDLLFKSVRKAFLFHFNCHRVWKFHNVCRKKTA